MEVSQLQTNLTLGQDLTLLAVLTKPGGKLWPLTHVAKRETGWSDKAEDRVDRHQTPLLLGSMNHAVHKISITDT